MTLRLPSEMGGDGGGTNPEQLFAVGYAACFEGALGVVGRREKVETGDASIDSKVSLVTTEERGFNVAVELDVTLPQVSDPEEAKRIVAGAHEVCPYSNATRGNIDVKLTANGQPVELVLRLPVAERPAATGNALRRWRARRARRV